MLNKLKNLSENQKVALSVVARIAVPMVAIVITDVLVKKVSKKDA